jgi:DNA-binding PadR family transcriptional regulator
LKCYRALKQLERESLIRIDEKRQYFEETIAFRITPLGVELLAASVGLIETDLDDLCLAHPKALLFSPPLRALSVDRWTNYVDQLLINHPEYLF